MSERYKIKEMLDSIEGSDNLKLKVLRDLAAQLKVTSGSYTQDQSKILRNVTDLDKYIDHIAAYMVRNTMPNYDYIGKFAEYFQILPKGNFTAFPTEITRTSFNNAQLIKRLGLYRPSNNPKLIEAAKEENVELPEHPFLERATERLIGFIVGSWGLVAAGSGLSQLLFNVDDEDIEAAAEISPEWAKERKIFISEKRSSEDGGGFPAYINPNYIAPYEEIGKFFFVLLRVMREQAAKGYRGSVLPAEAKALDRALGEFAVNYFNSYTDTTIAAEVFTDVFVNNLRGASRPDNPKLPKAVVNISDDFNVQLLDKLNYIMKEAGPGFYKQGATVLDAALAKGDSATDRYGREKSLMLALGKAMGMSTSSIDPTLSMQILTTGFINQNERYVKENLNFAWSQQGDVMPKEKIIREWQNAQRAYFTLQQDMYFSFQALQQLNVNEEEYETQIERLVRGISGGDNFADNLEQGIFTPWNMSEKLQDKVEETADEKNLAWEWPENEIYEQFDLLERSNISLSANATLNRVPTLNQSVDD